jgi:cytochrome o ubiquinol oxidase subunit 1
MDILGRLTLSAIPHDPIILTAGGGMILAAIAVLGLITFLGKWQYLWKEWLTTVDHKKIGIMYLIVAFVMLLRGFTEAVMMKIHQAMALGVDAGYLPPAHYDQFFTVHGVIMIFFVAMPFMFGLLNFIVPLQIGARDVAFPFLNSLSFWLLASSAILMNTSLVVGEFAATGWLAYPPLSGISYSPGVGVDYYIWALQISGVGTLLSGINFFVTIVKMRCPGMTLMRMPIFTWSALCSMTLVILAFPVLTATLGMLSLDRLLDMKFFTSDAGGNVMMYINLIWIWGHPEVYILVLPAFGIFSEVVSVFSRKKLFGYVTMVAAMAVITVLSYIVWLHHFFTMGSGASVNAFFGIATMIISIPTGVKIFNWLFTMYRGKITFTTPMLWTMGFMITFTVGGMTGVMLSVPGVNFQVHNSLFVVAHFHNTIIGGALFGYFAGFIYWFPKMFGFKLNEKIGKYAFWCWNIGFYVTFLPIYLVGLMGMTRRLNYYESPEWQPLLIISAIGAGIIAIGVVFQVVQLLVSIKNRKQNLDTTGDPWDARTLEWETSSPPAFYNFAHEPKIDDIDDYWYKKQHGKTYKNGEAYQPIHMPKNTAVGLVIGMLCLPFGFAIIWHIWWLVILSFVAILITMIYRSFDYKTDYYVTVAEIEAEESKRNYIK